MSSEDETMTNAQRRSAEMTTRLLDAAENLYGREGPKVLTNRRIATEANTTTQSIYTYFGGQDHLIEAMWRRAIDGVTELLDLALSVESVQGRVSRDQASDERAAQDQTTVLESLFLAAHAYREYCLSHPGRFRLIQRAGNDAGTPRDAAQLREKVFDHLVEFGQDNSPWYPARLRLTLAAIHGLIQAELDGFVTERDDPQRLLTELVHRFFVPYDELPSRQYPELPG